MTGFTLQQPSPAQPFLEVQVKLGTGLADSLEATADTALVILDVEAPSALDFLHEQKATAKTEGSNYIVQVR